MENIGSLDVVGIGLRAGGDVCVSAKAYIEQADIVLIVVPDSFSKNWLVSLNSNIQDLTNLYQQGKSRAKTYHEMTQKIIDEVKSGQKVCAVFYGHPGVFVNASHQAIKSLKSDGFRAQMLPGISAEDWLFSDLNIDPGTHGCMSIEATQFLLYERPHDIYAYTILWQIGLIGDHTLTLSKTNQYHQGLTLLKEKLLRDFPQDHELTIYEASTLSILSPRIERVSLEQLTEIKLTAASTLIIPPVSGAPFNAEVMAALNLSNNDIKEPLNIDEQ